MRELLIALGIGLIVLVVAAASMHSSLPLVPGTSETAITVRVLEASRAETVGYLAPGKSVIVELHVKMRYGAGNAVVYGDVKAYPKGIGMGQFAYVEVEGARLYLRAGYSRFLLADLAVEKPSEIVVKVRFSEVYPYTGGAAYQTWVYWQGSWVKTAQWLGSSRTTPVVVEVAEQ